MKEESHYKRVSGDAIEYEVFARKARVDALHLVGSVVAPDADLAMAYARATYDRASRTAQMISDFVEYDKASAKAESLEQKLELDEKS